MDKFSVIDLFAGAGGLSLGFEQTQKYKIKVAFENNPKMQETYQKNHPDVKLFDDVCTADYHSIEKEYGKFDVVIGGPPCQGFSNANRQRSSAINKNNMLVKQYIRAIIELQPKAFVMENVSMLKSDVHRFYMEKSDKSDVKRFGIPTKMSEIHLLEKEYLFDGVVALVKNKDGLKKELWPDVLYSELNVIYKSSKNPKKLVTALDKHKKKLMKITPSTCQATAEQHIQFISGTAFEALFRYYAGTLNTEGLIAALTPAIMLQRMVKRALEILDNSLLAEEYVVQNGISARVKSFAVYDYLKAILESDENGYVITSKVLCATDYGAPQKRMRFVVAGIKKKISAKIALPQGRFDEDQYRTVRDAISDLEDVQPVCDIEKDTGIPLSPKPDIGELGSALRNTETLYNHIVTKTTDVAMERFLAIKQGKNFHSLKDELKTNTYTDAKRTQNTIYLRLDYDEPSGTVVNVRKSMWIHPTQNRAISIREAARLQTFPDSFVFCGTKDSQYQQVGNAVPPIMAKSIAKKLAQILFKGLHQEFEDNG